MYSKTRRCSPIDKRCRSAPTLHLLPESHEVIVTTPVAIRSLAREVVFYKSLATPPPRACWITFARCPERHRLLRRGIPLPCTNNNITSSGQGLIGWGHGPLALPLRHCCCVDGVLSPRLVLNLNESEPAHRNSGKRSPTPLFCSEILRNNGFLCSPALSAVPRTGALFMKYKEEKHSETVYIILQKVLQHVVVQNA